MAMLQHTFGVYVWRSVWRCKLDSVFKCFNINVIN